MLVIGICGPIGSSIEEFAIDFAKLAKSHTQKICIINEKDHTTVLNMINFDELATQIDNSDASLCLVIGHKLFTNEDIKSKCTIKLFLEKENDLCFSQYIKGCSQEELSNKIDIYNNNIKLMNDEVINPSKKWADLFIPERASIIKPINASNKCEKHAFEVIFQLLLSKIQAESANKKASNIDQIERSAPEILSQMLNSRITF